MTKNPREFLMAVFAFEFCEKIWISFFQIWKFAHGLLKQRNNGHHIKYHINWDVEYEKRNSYQLGLSEFYVILIQHGVIDGPVGRSTTTTDFCNYQSCFSVSTRLGKD